MRKALTAATAIAVITRGSLVGAGAAAAHVDTYKPPSGLDNGYLPCNLQKVQHRPAYVPQSDIARQPAPGPSSAPLRYP